MIRNIHFIYILKIVPHVRKETHLEIKLYFSGKCVISDFFKCCQVVFISASSYVVFKKKHLVQYIVKIVFHTWITLCIISHIRSNQTICESTSRVQYSVPKSRPLVSLSLHGF